MTAAAPAISMRGFATLNGNCDFDVKMRELECKGNGYLARFFLILILSTSKI